MDNQQRDIFGTLIITTKWEDLKTKYIIFYIGINEELYLQKKNFPKKLNFKSYFFDFLKTMVLRIRFIKK